MHERTQKALCQLAFVGLCALPTTLVVLWIVATWTPWYHSYQRQQVEAHLSAQLGLRVELDRFEQPAPATFKLTGIRLFEHETGAKVGQVRLAVFSVHDEKRVLQIHQPELQSAQLQHAWRMVHDRFLCQPQFTAQPMVITANALTLHSKSGGVTLRDTVARIVPGERQIEASLEFIPVGRESNTKAWVGITRDRTLPIPETHWRLNTGGVPLPCSALADYLPVLRNLGPEADFNGSMAWHLSSQGWSVDLAGATFSGIELSEVFDGLPHKLSGRATIQLERCQIQPGESIDVSGSLVATSGYIGESLLEAAHTHLGISPTPAVESESNTWYDLLALRFDMFGSKLRLRGDCHHQRGYESLPPNVVLATQAEALEQRTALAVRTDELDLPATNLVAAMAPRHAALVPYTRQTAGLRGLLLPPDRTLPDDVPPPSPRITLRRD